VRLLNEKCWNIEEAQWDMKQKKGMRTQALYKLFIYVVLIALAVSIMIPVAWIFLASIKENVEFYENPWSLPAGFHYQNFMEAFVEAVMGSYLGNSIIVTVVAMAVLLIVALSVVYVLSRFTFFGSKVLNSFVKAGLFVNVSYIAVPIFLMLLGWDESMQEIIGEGIFLNNRIMLAIIYAATALPFTIFLLTSYFET